MTDRFDPEELRGAYQRLPPELKSMCDLWRSVIAQAVRDLGSTVVDIAADAARWLGVEEATTSFKQTCFLALLDWESVEDALRGYLRQPDPYRTLHLYRLSDRILAGQPPASDVTE